MVDRLVLLPELDSECLQEVQQLKHTAAALILQAATSSAENGVRQLRSPDDEPQPGYAYVFDRLVVCTAVVEFELHLGAVTLGESCNNLGHTVKLEVVLFCHRIDAIAATFLGGHSIEMCGEDDNSVIIQLYDNNPQEEAIWVDTLGAGTVHTNPLALPKQDSSTPDGSNGLFALNEQKSDLGATRQVSACR